jgi:nucleotide-binding universal stress UspA family protein
MFQHVVVPIDGSEASWRAVPIAAKMAAFVDGTLDVVAVVGRDAVIGDATDELADGLARLGVLPVVADAQVIAGDSVSEVIADHVESRNGAICMMSSHGHGRSATVLGSVTDEVLRRLYGPIVVVGPHVQSAVADLGGRYVVPLDGSSHGDTILPVASAWWVEFDAEPWLVEVLDPKVGAGADYSESAYPARRARELSRATGREVQYDVLHDGDPAAAINGFAERIGAGMIFSSTHGRSGLQRLRLGSVAADLVRHAPCPVVLYRPPHLAEG